MLKVGTITSTHALQGALVLQQIIESTDWLKKGDTVFIEVKKDSLIPYFVQSVKAANKNELIIQFDDVENVEDAKQLLKKTIFVKEEILEEAKVNSPLMYIGYNLVDKVKGGVGVIDDVMLIGKQWIAKLIVENQEVLIPLADDLMIDVNHKNKFIRMILPEGLLEVYLDK